MRYARAHSEKQVHVDVRVRGSWSETLSRKEAHWVFAFFHLVFELCGRVTEPVAGPRKFYGHDRSVPPKDLFRHGAGQAALFDKSWQQFVPHNPLVMQPDETPDFLKIRKARCDVIFPDFFSHTLVRTMRNISRFRASFLDLAHQNVVQFDKDTLHLRYDDVFIVAMISD